jgi:hypothetical protein
MPDPLVASSPIMPLLPAVASVPDSLPVVTESTVRHVALPDIPLLPKEASKALIVQWCSLVQMPDMLHPHLAFISQDMLVLIEHKFAVFFIENPLETCCAYDVLSKKEFCRILILVFSDVLMGIAVNLSLSRRLKNADLVKFSLADSNVENNTVIDITNIVKEFVTPNGISTLSDSMEIDAVKVLNECLPKFPVDWRSIVNAKDAKTVKSWISMFLIALMKARQVGPKAVMYGYTVTMGPNTQHNTKTVQKRPAHNPPDASRNQPPASKKPRSASSNPCTGCGRSGHSLDSCHFTAHPDFNASNNAWNVSDKGKAWAKKGKTFLPASTTLSGAEHKFVFPVVPDASTASNAPVRTVTPATSSTPMKGMHIFPGFIPEFELASTLSSLSHSNNNHLLPCTISVSSQGANLAAARSIKVGALLDTGSLAGDFISQEVVDEFRLKSNTVTTPRLVCSGLDNTCINLNKTVPVTVLFTNELTSKINSVLLNAYILKDSPIDLIVGLPSIKKYNLFQAVPSLISNTVNLTDVRTCTNEPALGNLKNTQKLKTEKFLTSNPLLHASLIDSADRIFGAPSEDNNEIPAKVGSFEPWLGSHFPTDDPLSKIHISGSDTFRKQKSLDICSVTCYLQNQPN